MPIAIGGPILLALTLPNLQAQFYDFNDGTDTDWTRYDPIGSHPQLPDIATFSFPDGGYRLQTAVSPDPAAVGPGRAGSLLQQFNFTDFYIEVDVVNWDSVADQAFGILARVSSPGLGTLNGYAFTFETGNDFDMSVITGEQPDQFESGPSSFALDPAKDYRFVFIGKGSSFVGRVYELPNTITPVFTLEGTDSTYTSGYVGLVTFDNSGGTGITDATFDNFLVQIAESPRMNIVLTTIDEFEVTWPIDAGPFRLQSSTALPGGWVDVDPEMIFTAPPNYIYREGRDPDFSQQKFFRLIQD